MNSVVTYSKTNAEYNREHTDLIRWPPMWGDGLEKGLKSTTLNMKRFIVIAACAHFGITHHTVKPWFISE